MPVKVPVEYETNGAGLERDLTKDTASAGRKGGAAYGKGFSTGVKTLVGATVGLLAVGGAKEFLKSSIDEAEEAQKVGRLTAQVIKTTGGAANVSAKQFGTLATAISKNVGIDDEQIQSGENLLATFTNIRNSVGKNNDIFNRATRASVDLAAGLAAASGSQVNLRSSTVLVGKALNDPVKGLTALSRVGIRFTDEQTKAIKTDVARGKSLNAQKIILDQLQKKFGGAAASQATAGDKLQVSIKNLEETIGDALLPELERFQEFATTKVVPAISTFVTGMEDGTGAGGRFADTLKTDVLPVARHLATEAVQVGKALEPVLHILEKIPAPVLATGGSLAVLSRGLSKIGPTLPETATNMEKVGSAARSLVGAGGLLLLADSADKAGTSMGTLEKITGAALAGGALGSIGGPVGAAVGAGAGAIAASFNILGIGAHHAWTETKIAVGTFKDYESTLDGVSAASTKATRTMAFQRLEQSGLLKVTEAMGLSDRTAVSAVLGNASARQKLANTLLTSTHATQAQKAALEQETGSLGAARLAQLRQNVATASGAANLRDARAALKRFMAEPANKRVAITGLETVKAELNGVRGALNQVFGLAQDINNIKGGVGSLLTTPIKKKALGGPVTAGQPYIVGERRPELFVPNTSGRIVPQVPQSSGSEQGGGNFTYAPVFSGPQTGRDRLSELSWTMRYASRARGGVASVA